jgi:hypothetical protein
VEKTITQRNQSTHFIHNITFVYLSLIPSPALSQYYFQLIKQYKDYRTESIQAVEIKMIDYNELMTQKGK